MQIDIIIIYIRHVYVCMYIYIYINVCVCDIIYVTCGCVYLYKCVMVEVELARYSKSSNLEASFRSFGCLPAIPVLSMPRGLALSTPWGGLRSSGGATSKLLLRGFQLQQVAFMFLGLGMIP